MNKESNGKSRHENMDEEEDLCPGISVLKVDLNIVVACYIPIIFLLVFGVTHQVLKNKVQNQDDYL